MSHVIQVQAAGGAEQLVWTQQPDAEPGAGEVLLRHDAIGINPLDISQRKGVVPFQFPSRLGLEGAGVVLAVGPGVDTVTVGDRVAYATGPVGAYADQRIYPANRLVPLPDTLASADAAALLFKGITAQYLLKTTYEVGAGTRVLLYGASGGVGQLMAAWARHLGAHVIGVVSRDASIDRARQAGCHDVLVFDAERLPGQVKEITGGRMADVVYDGLGKRSFDASLSSLRVRGLMVSFGVTTGAPPAVEVGTLNAKGSLYLTRPSLAAHTADPAEYQARARDVLDAQAHGILRAHPAHTFALKDAREAHTLMERGGNTGAIVLVP